MSTQADSVREFLVETLHLAGAELNLRQGEKLQVDVKADSSLVTEADLASERVILKQIMHYFPDDEIYSEEAGVSSHRRQAGGYVWIIDPLDGTTNYCNNYPFYCVSIGRGRFQADGSIEMVAGGIFDPTRDKLYYAGLGQGAYLDQRRLYVTKSRELSKSFLVTGFYYTQGEALETEVRRFASIAQICQSIRRDGAAALDLALVAEGVYDAFWEVGLKSWDVAAGTLLVTEAGGKVRNYKEGSEGSYNVEGVGVVAGAEGTVEAIAAFL